MKKAIDLIRQQSKIELPSYAVPVLATNAIYIADNLAHIADGGDYSSLEDIRKTIEFLADQFGGEVKWDIQSTGENKQPIIDDSKSEELEKCYCSNCNFGQVKLNL